MTPRMTFPTSAQQELAQKASDSLRMAADDLKRLGGHMRGPAWVISLDQMLRLPQNQHFAGHIKDLDEIHKTVLAITDPSNNVHYIPHQDVAKVVDLLADLVELVAQGKTSL